MQALLVGAGAVGHVYAFHLQRAGARVAFLVRPHRAEGCRQGMPLYRLTRRGPQEHFFQADDVLTDLGEVRARDWDQVWLCVPTTALDEGMERLLEAVGDATVVALQPGTAVRERLSAHLSPPQLVWGAIAMVAYQAPLPGHASEMRPGVSYAFPFRSASRFDGEEGRVEPIVRALRRGGCPAKVDHHADRFLAFTSAMLMPLVAALEAEQWSLAALRGANRLGTAARAARQALRIVARHLGVRPPLYRLALRRPLLRLGLVFAARAVPFDLERYLHYHFTKVRAQTQLLFEDYRRAARDHGLDASAVEELADVVGSG